jgi:hypothetical protein
MSNTTLTTRILALSLLATLAFGFVIGATTGTFYGDFWEHAAIASSLTTNLAIRDHPFFELVASHAFLSPYALLIACVAFVFDLSPINALASVGPVNFCLLALGLYFFIATLEKGFAVSATTYALLAFLFLWGSHPWGYSGFFHYRVIADVLPYPSTFALALTLIALSLNAYKAQHNSYLWKPIVFLLFWLVLLTHPLTAIFFACGLIAQLWCVPKRQALREVLLNAAFGLLAVGAATLWPYYSIIDLVSGAGDVYHPENKSMYVDVLSRIWPTLVALPFAAWALKDRRGQSILLIILMLAGVYLYGGMTEKYSYGRVISIIMILLQILIAIGLARLEVSATARLPAFRFIVPTVLFGSLLYFSMPWLIATSTRALTVANSIRLGRPISNQHSYKDLLFLAQQVGARSVVLSDINTSWIVPSIRGKVVGALHPQAFVPDQKQRFDDVNTFFGTKATVEQQLAIAKKYRADFLLLNKERTPHYQGLLEHFTTEGRGQVTFTSGKYILIKLSLSN